MTAPKARQRNKPPRRFWARCVSPSFLPPFTICQIKKRSHGPVELLRLLDVRVVTTALQHCKPSLRQRVGVILTPRERRNAILATPHDQGWDRDPGELSGRVRNSMISEVTLNRVAVPGGEPGNEPSAYDRIRDQGGIEECVEQARTRCGQARSIATRVPNPSLVRSRSSIGRRNDNRCHALRVV